MKVVYFTLLIGVFYSLSIQNSWAKGNLEYPELMVNPKASHRLKLEAREESQNAFKTSLPMQLSATTTLIAGILQMSNVDLDKDSGKDSPMAGIIIGGGWLIFNYYNYHQYLSYKRGWNKIKKMSKKKISDQIAYERFAEEQLNRAASFNKKLKWASLLTNLGASIYMISNTKKSTSSIPVNGLSILMSFMPILFPNKYEFVAHEQKLYKKRIYRPIITASLLQDPNGKGLVPGAIFSLRF